MLPRACVVVAVLVCALCGQASGGLLSLDFEDTRGFEWDKESNSSIPEIVLDIYAPVSGEEDSIECREHSQLYREAARHEERWALKMLDASSLVPGSHLVGNRLQLGNYDECLSVESGESVSGPFSGQHCMVTTLSADRRASRWAVCIPSSCTPRDLESHLRTALRGLAGNSTVTVGEHACSSRQQAPSVSIGSWVVIAFLILLAVLVVGSTVYDLIKPHAASRSAVLAAFSVPATLNKLLATHTDGATVQALHGIRALSTMLVVLGQVDKYTDLIPRTNELRAGVVRMMTHQLAIMSIDTFFIVSGLLVTYGFFRRREAGKTSNLAVFYLHRYIRLTPPLALMMLLSATVLGDAGDGPLWRENVVREQQHCQDNWWAGLIYLNNYIYPHTACLRQSWFLAANMQMLWLSPIVLYLIVKWPKFWRVLIGALVVVGFMVSFPWEWLSVMPGEWSDLHTRHFMATHTRVTPWVMGMGLGYVLHATKTTPANMSGYKVALGWVVCAMLFVSSFLIISVTEDISGCLARPFWSVSMLCVVYMCHKGYGGFANRLLSWDVFQVLGRLSYSVYLVHLSIILMLLGSTRTPVHLSCTSYVMQSVGVLVLSYIAGLVLYFVCEAPVLAIEQSFMDSEGCTRGKEGSYTVDEGAFQDTPEGLKLSTLDMPFIDEDRKIWTNDSRDEP